MIEIPRSLENLVAWQREYGNERWDQGVGPLPLYWWAINIKSLQVGLVSPLSWVNKNPTCALLNTQAFRSITPFQNFKNFIITTAISGCISPCSFPNYLRLRYKYPLLNFLFQSSSFCHYGVLWEGWGFSHSWPLWLPFQYVQKRYDTLWRLDHNRSWEKSMPVSFPPSFIKSLSETLGVWTLSS